MKQKLCALWATVTLVAPFNPSIGALPESPPATTSNSPASQTTLDALVDEALEKNPELNFYRAEIAAAKAERKTAGTLANPQLNTQIGQKRVRDGSGTGQGEGAAWSVTVLQTFEYPGRIGLRKAIANRQIELAELGFDQFRATLASRTRSLAYNVFVSQ